MPTTAATTLASDTWDRFICLRDWTQEPLGEECVEG